MDVLSLKLQFLVVTRDVEIAQLTGQILIERLRTALKASPYATFQPETMTFTEPVVEPVPEA